MCTGKCAIRSQPENSCRYNSHAHDMETDRRKPTVLTKCKACASIALWVSAVASSIHAKRVCVYIFILDMFPSDIRVAGKLLSSHVIIVNDRIVVGYCLEIDVVNVTLKVSSGVDLLEPP